MGIKMKRKFATEFTYDSSVSGWDSDTWFLADELADELLVDWILGNRSNVPWSGETRFWRDKDNNFVGWDLALHVDGKFVSQSMFIPANANPTGLRARVAIILFGFASKVNLMGYGYKASPLSEYNY